MSALQRCLHKTALQPAKVLARDWSSSSNDYRLIAVVQYANDVLLIRFFGSHEEYDKVDAETV
jgi:mRNA-degrading endonuclease HigB of HigAB toxin-antitoxin module